MGLSKKLIKCTISHTNKPAFTCDLWLWQNIPSDLGPYGGYFERIRNEKPLQIEANEGTWELNTMVVSGSLQSLQLFKNPRTPTSSQIIDLTQVPFDFIDAVIEGKIFSGKDRGVIYNPLARLDWRIWT